MDSLKWYIFYYKIIFLHVFIINMAVFIFWSSYGSLHEMTRSIFKFRIYSLTFSFAVICESFVFIRDGCAKITCFPPPPRDFFRENNAFIREGLALYDVFRLFAVFFTYEKQTIIELLQSRGCGLKRFDIYIFLINYWIPIIILKYILF